MPRADSAQLSAWPQAHLNNVDPETDKPLLSDRLPGASASFPPLPDFRRICPWKRRRPLHGHMRRSQLFGKVDRSWAVAPSSLVALYSLYTLSEREKAIAPSGRAHGLCHAATPVTSSPIVRETLSSVRNMSGAGRRVAHPRAPGSCARYYPARLSGPVPGVDVPFVVPGNRNEGEQAHTFGGGFVTER